MSQKIVKPGPHFAMVVRRPVVFSLDAAGAQPLLWPVLARFESELGPGLVQGWVFPLYLDPISLTGSTFKPAELCNT